MQTFEQIVDEKAELDARRNELLELMDSKDFEKLPYGERNRMVIQSNAMRDYGDALNERIRALEAAAKPVTSRDVSELYYELLYAVARKFPNESRHETALRYIREAELPTSQTGASAEKGS
jgi:hypothetical protein